MEDKKITKKLKTVELVINSKQAFLFRKNRIISKRIKADNKKMLRNCEMFVKQDVMSAKNAQKYTEI